MRLVQTLIANIGFRDPAFNAQRLAVIGDIETTEGLADRLWAAPPHHMQGHEDAVRWQRGILEAFGTRP